MRIVCILFVLIVMTGCDSITSDDAPATLQAELTTIADEGIALQQTVAVAPTELASTIVAMEIEISQLSSENQHLLSTVEAVGGNQSAIARSPNIVSTSPPEEFMMAENSQSSFGNLQAARTVREDDGCADVVQSEFRTTDERIYFSAEALNLLAGTELMVDWMFEGQQVATTNWTADSNQRTICIWFFIENLQVPFTAGSWTATLFANGQQQDFPISFTIVDG